LNQERLIGWRVEYDLQTSVHNRIYYAGVLSKYLAQLPIDINSNPEIPIYSNHKSASVNRLWLLTTTTRYTVAPLDKLNELGIDDLDGDYRISTAGLDNPTVADLKRLA
jgi:hypothetical protein